MTVARRLQGLGAVLLLFGILVGVPAVLMQLATRPGFLPGWFRLQTALTAPDDGRLLLVVIWGAAWILWVMMTWLILLEIIASIRGIPAPNLPVMSIPQGMAVRLVATAALIFVALPATTTAHADPAPTDGAPPTTVASTLTPTTAAAPVPKIASSERQDYLQVVVGAGDTLWGYAEDYLGDGNLWPVIYEANRGVSQAEGGALTDPDMIHEGWHLTIPIPTTERTPIQPATIVEQQQKVVVGPGDTLWGYAEEYLGEGDLWPVIFEANRGVSQAEGGALTDPDMIHEGWQLTIPTPTEARAPAQTDTANTPDTTPTIPENTSPPLETALPPVVHDTTPTTGPSVQETVSRPPAGALPPTPQPPTHTPSATAAPANTEALDPWDDVNEAGESQPVPVWQVAGLAGAGAFLGAGVFAVLRRRRRDQFRHRQPGLMITTPDPIVAPIEMTATQAAGLTTHRLTRIDHVLRATAANTPTLPKISAIGLHTDDTITLHTTTELPGPWQPTADAWLLPADMAPEQIGPYNPDTPAPYPLLATIGVNDTGTTWLLNLEHHGTLTVAGDEVMRDDFVRYLAAELTVNPWSSDVRVACLGLATETVAMAPDRFTTNDDDITGLATANVERATRTATTAATGRLYQLEDEAWAAVAMIASDSTTGHELRDLIETHPHRTGAALIRCATTGDLNLSGGGRLTGFGFDLIPVGLTTDEAVGCAALLSVANDTSTGRAVAPADVISDKTGNLLPTSGLDRDDTVGPAPDSVLPAPDGEYTEVAPVTTVDLQLLAPKVRPGVAAEILDGDPDLDRDVAEWFSPRCSQPRLTWLGPVKARCHGTPPAKSKAYYVEVLSFLAAHPHGVTNDQLADAFSITRERVHAVISNLRRWVAVNPDTRRPHIPEAKKSRHAEARGIGLYFVENLLNDADLFRRLRTRAHARGADGIHDLETALTLVTGRPFDQLRVTGWAWLADGDRIDHHLTCAISDVAHTLVTHYLHESNLVAARKAAETGLTACPESETATLDLAGIMVHEGNTQAARELLSGALSDLDADGDPADPSNRAAQIFLGKKYLRTA